MVTIKEHNQRYLEAMNYIMETRGLTLESFSKSLDATRTILSQVKGGKQNASIDIITKTVLVYPEINADYILTGRGSMFIQEQESYDSAINEQNEELIEKLQSELKEAYTEIGRLNMELNKLKAI
jgi:hypothetical protein